MSNSLTEMWTFWSTEICIIRWCLEFKMKTMTRMEQKLAQNKKTHSLQSIFTDFSSFWVLLMIFTTKFYLLVHVKAHWWNCGSIFNGVFALELKKIALELVFPSKILWYGGKVGNLLQSSTKILALLNS